MTRDAPPASAARRPGLRRPSRSRICSSPTWSAGSARPVLRASRSRSRRARPMAWWGSLAAASPRRPMPRSASAPQWPDHRRPHSHRGADITKMSRRRGPPVPRETGIDGLPGPGRRPESEHAHRPAGGRGVHGPRPESRRGRSAMRLLRWTASTSRIRRASSIATRTSCRVACSSGSSSRWRSRRTRSRWSSTSRSPALTRPWRRACSPCSDVAQRDQCRDALDRAQPRSHPLAVRSRRGHVRGQDRGGGQRGRGVRAATVPLYLRPPALAPPHGVRKSQRALATIPGTLPQIGTTLPRASTWTAARSPTICVARSCLRSSTLEVGTGTLPPLRPDRSIPEPEAGVGQGPDGGVEILALSNVSKTSIRAGTTSRPRSRWSQPQRWRDPWPGRPIRVRQVDIGQTILGIEGPDEGSHIELDHDELQATASDPPVEAKRSIRDGVQNPDSRSMRLERPPDPEPLRAQADRPPRPRRPTRRSTNSPRTCLSPNGTST